MTGMAKQRNNNNTGEKALMAWLMKQSAEEMKNGMANIIRRKLYINNLDMS
jgi:hypothetical protein